MKVISLTGTVNLKNTCAAIGIFDGVHRGHAYLLDKMLAKAKALKAKSVVITFFPHPAHVLRPDVKLQYLVSLEERMRLLALMGIDVCIIVPFNKKFAHVLPESFIKKTLVDQLDVKALFVGDDFRFGRNRSGDVALFTQLAKKYCYEMHGVKALKQGAQPISSTRIRRYVTEGDLSGCRKLLGRDFDVFGTVVKGKGRGKGLGFPTANVQYDNGVMPPNGVYAVRVFYDKKQYPAVANLGIRPSFKEKEKKPLLEVHIFDFNKDLYGKKIDVVFIKKIREEKSFSSLDALKLQIAADVQKAHIILK